ncbi:MAG: hypothetical protein WCJ56_13830, partial [bacterium]
HTADGTSNITDVTENNYALNWSEWQGMTLNSSYNTRSTAQTQEKTTALNIDLAAALTREMKLTGKLSNNSRLLPNMTETADNNMRQLRLETSLTPALLFKNEYVIVNTPDQGDTTTFNNQATWKLSPSWTANMLLGRNERSLTGSEERREFGLNAALGSAEAPTTLLLQSGNYSLGYNGVDAVDNMLSVQVLQYRPLPSTAISVGYYQGPTLMTNSLIYRAWGTTPTANSGIWQLQDFLNYRELGGEITQTLDARTKLVVKQMRGETEAQGAQTTSEFGLERLIGKAILQLGRSSILLADGSRQQGTIWNIRMPFARPLPEWAGKTLRGTVFQDGGAWGFGQLPTWVTDAESGMTVGQKISLLNSVAIQDQSVSLGSMAGGDLYLQAGYQRNPKPVLELGDPGDRLMLHSAIALAPGLQLIGRYLQETLTDKPAILMTRSLGIMGNLTLNTQLQLQADWLTQRDAQTTVDGMAYQLQLAHTSSDNNALVVKYRLLPEFLRGDLKAQQIDVGYQLKF